MFDLSKSLISSFSLLVANLAMGCGASFLGDNVTPTNTNIERCGEGGRALLPLPADGCNATPLTNRVMDDNLQEIPNGTPRFSPVTRKRGTHLHQRLMESCPRKRIAPMQWVSVLTPEAKIAEIHPSDSMSFSDISTGSMSHLSNNYARSAANSRSRKVQQSSGVVMLSASNLPCGRPHDRCDASSPLPTALGTVFLMSSSLPVLHIDTEAVLADEGFMSATWGTNREGASSSQSVGLLLSSAFE